MKNNLAIFRGTVATPALQVGRAKDLQQNRTVQAHGEAKAPLVQPRPALIMIWRTNATSGRLECRWSLAGAQVDEGVSCNYFFRKAA
jgi:hypothetical protein